MRRVVLFHQEEAILLDHRTDLALLNYRRVVHTGNDLKFFEALNKKMKKRVKNLMNKPSRFFGF